ncbi:hypothetical protein [Vreelandella sp. EE22]
MLKQDVTVGPFTIIPGESLGQIGQRFEIRYNAKYSCEIVTPAKTKTEVIDAADDAISDLYRALRNDHERRHQIYLTDGQGEVISGFTAAGILPDMTPGLVDDRFEYWLKDESGKYSQVVTLGEFARLRAEHELPKYAWIANLLPHEVLNTDPDEWRAPTAWEIRHIVGFYATIGISGAAAAELVGVTPPNFRKYTAQESAKNRQSMSFAMWHLLLHRLGVQTLEAGVV